MTPPWWFFIFLFAYTSRTENSPFCGVMRNRLHPASYDDVTKTSLFLNTGVAMTAVSPWRWARQRTLPSSASTPATLSPVSWMYWRLPPISTWIGDEYAAESVQSLVLHICCPVFLFRASSVPFGPPGVQITLSPSTRTD